jgi:hypothetical protein
MLRFRSTFSPMPPIEPGPSGSETRSSETPVLAQAVGDAHSAASSERETRRETLGQRRLE